MLRHLWGGCVVLLVVGVPAVSAQVREVSGRVTNEETGQGVGEAVISVEGTRIAIRSAADSRFVFNIPDGDQRLTVRAIGFKRDSAFVPATAKTVTVALEPDPFKLEEVVVTGLKLFPLRQSIREFGIEMTEAHGRPEQLLGFRCGKGCLVGKLLDEIGVPEERSLLGVDILEELLISLQ